MGMVQGRKKITDHIIAMKALHFCHLEGDSISLAGERSAFRDIALSKYRKKFGRVELSVPEAQNIRPVPENGHRDLKEHRGIAS